MKKTFLYLCLSLGLCTLPAWAYDENDSAASPAVAETAPTPVSEQNPEQFGVGACLGQGAGLGGAYFKINPMDHLGFEATVGKRLFMLLVNDDVEMYWPTSAAVKARYYFMDRTGRFNPGIEGGVMFTEDLGTGGEASGVFTFRINRHLHLDASLGIGVMPNAKSNQIDYLVKVRGRTRSYYENNVNFAYDSSIMLFWGFGIAFMF